jgi:hypothetical protein
MEQLKQTNLLKKTFCMIGKTAKRYLKDSAVVVFLRYFVERRRKRSLKNNFFLLLIVLKHNYVTETF